MSDQLDTGKRPAELLETSAGRKRAEIDRLVSLDRRGQFPEDHRSRVANENFVHPEHIGRQQLSLIPDEIGERLPPHLRADPGKGGHVTGYLKAGPFACYRGDFGRGSAGAELFKKPQAITSFCSVMSAFR